MADAANSAAFTLLAGRLCLDFANTADWHASDRPQEGLTSYSVLVAWSRQAGILTEHEAERLLLEATRCPDDAASVLRRAIALREGMYRIFSAVARQLPSAESDLVAFNAALTQALGRLRVVRAGDGYGWGWRGDSGELDRMLWPIARSAGELLTSEELGRVRQCAGDPCGWLFLDTSRNRSRRWCDMESCGNRAKARRHYRRKRATSLSG